MFLEYVPGGSIKHILAEFGPLDVRERGGGASVAPPVNVGGVAV